MGRPVARVTGVGPPSAQVEPRVQRGEAFVGRDASESYFVICDERLNDAAAIACGQFQLLFGFAASRPGDFQTYLVTHQPDSSAARTVSVNRYALPHQS